MNKVKELLVYVIIGVVLIMLGSIYQVSNAQTAEESEELPTDAEMKLLRSQLVSESVMLENYTTFEENRNVVLKELLVEFEAEKKAKEEAERKARLEAERKAKEEAERLAKIEADKKAKEQALLNNAKVQAELKAKQQIKADTQQQTLYVTATAYTSYCKGCTGVTSTGYNVRNTIYYKGMRVIAADTSILPFGTVVEIEGYGKAVVLDRGGAIKGHKIDFLVASTSDAYSFGRKHNLKITVVGSVSY